jgi:type II secretory pathway component PulM
MKMAMQTSLSNSIAQIAEPARSVWAKLSPSGQRAVGVASVLLALGLVWALVYEPLQQSRAKDTQRIAQLRADLAQMQALAAERQSLKSLPNLPTAGAAASTRRADVGSLQAELGAAFKVSLVTSGSGSKANEARAQYRVAVADVAYTELIDRLAAASQRYRLTTREMQLTRKSGSGQSVSGAVILTEAL